MFGVWVAGAVFVPVNPRAPDPEVREGARSDGSGRTDPGGWPARAARPGARTYEPDAAFVMWTSGTTGEPKPILHTHSAYFELLDRVLGPLRAGVRDPARPPTPNLIAVSLSLNAGIYNVLFGLRAGAAIVVMDGFETSEFATLVRHFGIRSTVLPPAAMTMLGRRPVGHRPRAAALRAQHHRAALPDPGAALHREVRRHRAQRLRPGRDRRGDRLDRGRRA